MNFNQLDDGEDRLGTKLETFESVSPNVYADFTIQARGAAGLPTDKVTLDFEGDFRKTFEVDVTNTFMQVLANEKKPDGKISDNIDTNDIYNLNTANTNILIQDYILPELNKEIKHLAGI